MTAQELELLVKTFPGMELFAQLPDRREVVIRYGDVFNPARKDTWFCWVYTFFEGQMDWTANSAAELVTVGIDKFKVDIREVGFSQGHVKIGGKHDN